MKTRILTITAVILSIGLTAFGQQSQKLKKANKSVAMAQNNLREAKTDSAADFQRFKKAAELDIAENEKNIAALKEKKAIERKALLEKYDNMVLDLERENDALQYKIDNSATTKTDMWAMFKLEFNHDMAKMRRAIEDND